MYRDGSRWRFALSSESAIVDGTLVDLDEGVALEVAQEALIRQIEKSSGKQFTATWSTDKPDWWRADLVERNAH
jgi:hypothetical protein